jgi:hypothetical protein
MRICFLLLFLTLVLARAEAAPETSIKVQPIQTKESKSAPSSEPSNFDSFQVTSPPSLPGSYPVLRKAPEATNNLGVGTGGGQFRKTKETESITTLHAQRTQYNSDESAQEFGLSVSTNHLIGVDLGYKKFCCFTSFARQLEPFYKIGFAGIYDPKDALGNFIDYQRYFFQLSAGFENLFASRRTWRIEAGARSGYAGTHVYGILIYAFPD